MKGKRRWLLAGLLLTVLAITGCGFLRNAEKIATTPEPVVVGSDAEEASEAEKAEQKAEAEEQKLISEIRISNIPEREETRAKGIYISAYVAGTPALVDNLINEFDRTEANALVIDFKDDFGRVVCETESPLVKQLGSTKVYIEDIAGLMQKLKDHHIYAIARIPAFRDAWLAEAQPDWCVKKADGTVFQDRDNHAWVNPYKEEAWEYLAEIALEAQKLGFDEIQFDYIRFSTEKGIGDVVYDEADVRGRDKKTVITEFVQYASEKLKDEGAFVAADVFGAVMGGGIDSDTVGQSYGDMANQLDYICPMIYPSHYGDGNFGIEHPDTQPYDTILAALQLSREDLSGYETEGQDQAAVRPWLQDFTASYLKNHIKYGNDEIRAQIQAVYDAGYEEWLLWSAACNYHWEALHDGENSETR